MQAAAQRAFPVYCDGARWGADVAGLGGGDPGQDPERSAESRIGSLMAAAQSYDAVYVMLYAMFKSKGDTSGPALKQALEHLDLNYQGVVTTYAAPFSERDHDAFTINSVWLGVWRNGEIGYYYPEDAKRSAYVRRKQQD